MERAEGGVWTYAREYPRGARDEYRFIVDGEGRLDPLNDHYAPGGFGPRSECRLPGYEPPRPVTLPILGTMVQRTIDGHVVDVYLPPRVEGAPLLVVADGHDYVWFAGLPGLLDVMIREGTIPPTVAAFVSPVRRELEYHANDAYVDWMADTLLPSIATDVPISPDPAAHGLIGASSGGVFATYGVLRRPDAFRLAGVQSPAYRAVDLGAIVKRVEPPWSSLRIHVDGGRLEMEIGGAPYLPHIRRGVALLRAVGATVQYNEVDEGHNYTNWRGRLPSVLTWLLCAGLGLPAARQGSQ